MKKVIWPVISFKLRRTEVTHSYNGMNIYNTIFIKNAGFYYPLVQPSLKPPERMNFPPLKRGLNPATVSILERPDAHFKLVRGKNSRIYSVEKPFIAPFREFEIIGVEREYQKILALYLAGLFGVDLRDALDYLSIQYKDPNLLPIALKNTAPKSIVNVGEKGVFATNGKGAKISFYIDGNELKVKFI